MRRVRNLALFAIGAFALLFGVGLILRPLLAPFMGVNFDAGAGGRAELRLPDGYRASVFAEGLRGPRFMAVAPDGTLLVAERGADRIVALPDADADGVADEVVEVGSGYGSAHDIALTEDGRLLVAGEAALYEVVLDGLEETDRRTVAGGLPTGGHSTKTVAVLPDGRLLLSIGSSCNVCDEEDDRRATVQVLEDGELRPWMVGLRNAVGVWVDPSSGRAWATNMGRDLLGDDEPPETLYELVDGADAGWPRCHAGSLRDPEFGTDATACDGVADPAATFPAHTAPLDAGRLGGSPRRCAPRIVELVGEGRLRAVVAALGRRAGRRARAVRHRLPARRRRWGSRPPRGPGGRVRRRALRQRRQGRVRLPHRARGRLSPGLTAPVRSGPHRVTALESYGVLHPTAHPFDEADIAVVRARPGAYHG